MRILHGEVGLMFLQIFYRTTVIAMETKQLASPFNKSSIEIDTLRKLSVTIIRMVNFDLASNYTS